MEKRQRKLERIAETINDLDQLTFEIRISRKNGQYAIEKYGKNDHLFYGALIVGNFKDVANYMLGMANAIYYTKTPIQ